MPFPLAHPAAVLPFKRYCPVFLSFPALVAGSLSPDAGYLFGEAASDVSHTLFGGMIFGLVVSLLMLAGFYMIGPHLVQRLPCSRQGALPSMFTAPKGSAVTVVLSVCIGVATHLLLDSFTHSRGWLVLHVKFLQTPLIPLSHRYVKLCHVLWYAFSFAGIVWLVLAFREWQERITPQSNPGGTKSQWLEAVLIAVLVIPIEVAHHLVHSKFGLVLVVAASLGLILAILARSTGLRQSSR